MLLQSPVGKVAFMSRILISARPSSRCSRSGRSGSCLQGTSPAFSHLLPTPSAKYSTCSFSPAVQSRPIVRRCPSNISSPRAAVASSVAVVIGDRKNYQSFDDDVDLRNIYHDSTYAVTHDSARKFKFISQWRFTSAVLNVSTSISVTSCIQSNYCQGFCTFNSRRYRHRSPTKGEATEEVDDEVFNLIT